MPIFVDTVYWLALLNRNDAWHARSVEWAGRIDEPLVTTDAVLTEVADALCRHDRRHWAIETLVSAKADPRSPRSRGVRSCSPVDWTSTGREGIRIGV